MQSKRANTAIDGGETEHLAAGDFSTWLTQARDALRNGGGTDVACGECTGCCSSSYFIHVKPSETAALTRIPRKALVPAAGQPAGHMLMGYDAQGLCPMLTSGKCSIYEDRPQTCRSYDCRIFSAAGLLAGGDDKATINRRIKRWRFSYPSEQDRLEHAAVQAAATFIRDHAQHFPGGRVPSDPIQLAILALKAHTVFLDNSCEANSGKTRPAADVANSIVTTCREFDR